jgi:hypothetical protein
MMSLEQDSELPLVTIPDGHHQRFIGQIRFLAAIETSGVRKRLRLKLGVGRCGLTGTWIWSVPEENFQVGTHHSVGISAGRMAKKV